MPIYEYCCGACGFKRDYLQKVADPAFTKCPQCGQETFGKVLSAPGFQLKGSGWYATDYKSNGAKKQAEGKNTDDKPAQSGHGCCGTCSCAGGTE